MRVLLACPIPPDRDGHGAIPSLLHMQLTGLLAHHDVTLVTVAGPEDAELDAVERLLERGLDVHAVRRTLAPGTNRWPRRRRLAGAWLRGRWPWRTAWFWEPEVQRIVDRLLATGAYDVADMEDCAMGVYRLPPGVGRVLNEYEVRRPRSVAAPPARVAGWPGWALGEADWRRWPTFQRSVWGRFDAVQVFSERDAQAVGELAPEVAPRVRVNPFGIELRPLADVEQEPDSLVFIGNYTHPPNRDAAVWLAREIMPRVLRERPSARLHLAGAQPPAAVRALEGPGVRVLGPVEDADLLMRRSAAVLAPVRIGGGMRMKVLHGMATGRAVITTSRGTEGLASEGRVPPLAVADDAEGLARTAVRLLADPAARHDLGSRARRFVEEHHSPEAYARRLEATYEAAIAARR